MTFLESFMSVPCFRNTCTTQAPGKEEEEEEEDKTHFTISNKNVRH